METAPMKTSRAVSLALVAVLSASAAAATLVAPLPAFAQSAAKATVDTAKAAGTVGEQGDGFLGLVNGSAGADVKAAVDEINAGRAAVYRDTVAKTGVSVEAAGEATANKLIARVPPGQYYKPAGGGWVRK
jgi:uncharacterized protein YdbL (DUF1318 family)